MRIAIPKETHPSENRVAMVPSLIPSLINLGCQVVIQNDAGKKASFIDQYYEGVEFCEDAKQLYQNADLILKVQAPSPEEIALFKKNAILIGLLSPHQNESSIRALCQHSITSFAMEFIPRISRAQSMDALSSQATVSGYKAALIAADTLNKFFPMLTTAAGTIKPARVLVIGAGVAGLQAIATAKRLGAIVTAYDIRTAAREQIESLGAKMINIEIKAEGTGGYARELSAEEKEKQQEVLKEAISKSDAIICTAFLPGKPAPKIITQEMVASMQSGTVIVDMAASAGGNCELTQPDETIDHNGVSIIGPTNLPSQLPKDASMMYAKNIVSFLSLLIKAGQLNMDWDDPIIAESALTMDGQIKHPPTKTAMGDKAA